jgi:hypothetical protein
VCPRQLIRLSELPGQQDGLRIVYHSTDTHCQLPQQQAWLLNLTAKRPWTLYLKHASRQSCRRIWSSLQASYLDGLQYNSMQAPLETSFSSKLLAGNICLQHRQGNTIDSAGLRRIPSWCPQSTIDIYIYVPVKNIHLNTMKAAGECKESKKPAWP